MLCSDNIKYSRSEETYCDFKTLPRRQSNHSFVNSNISIRVNIIGTNIIKLSFLVTVGAPSLDLVCPLRVPLLSVELRGVREGRRARHGTRSFHKGGD